jgi:glycosyltransferase involved in cell wall biosynthesis
MPVHNAEGTISFAMASVLGQTWSNLELIVVDDASSDGTWSLIVSFAARDQRVVPLRHEQNRGAYAARNWALRQASGPLVTVHDADDWSHPEKLALQALALLDGDGVANATKQIRVHPCMRVFVKPDGSTILDCYPSLMMQKAVLLELGGWDECRMGADDELWKRLLAKHRRSKTVLNETTPLSFHLFRDDSLTAQPHIGASSLYYGARRQYIEAYRYWHETEREKTEPDWSMWPGLRRFPIPAICKPGPTRRLAYDVLFVSDFSRPGSAAARNARMLRNAHALGLCCACFHWPRLECAGLNVDPTIRKLLHDEIADSVVAGESLACRLAVVSDAAILDHLPDALPEIRAGACLILAERGAAGSEICATNARAALGAFHQSASIRQIDEALVSLAEDSEPKSPGKTEPAPGESALANP